jgi:putative glutamine amidotransferase
LYNLYQLKGLEVLDTINKRPLIGVSGCRELGSMHPFHRCSEKYLLAVINPIGGTPVILPALPELEEFAEYIDGLLLTGSPSNVEPAQYSGKESEEGTRHDSYRDGTILPLIKECLKEKIPILGLCLGIQELNVACGGTLHQRIADLDNKFDHRMRRDEEDHEKRYRLAHNIDIISGGLLETITGLTETNVNSLHAQGVDQLGAGLRIDAIAPDGVVEAISSIDPDTFALGVQWHPEWPRPLNSVNTKIFKAFGEACRQRSLK